MRLNNIFARWFRRSTNRDIRDSSILLVEYAQLLHTDTDLSVRLIPSRVCVSILSQRDRQGTDNDIERYRTE